MRQSTTTNEPSNKTVWITVVSASRFAHTILYFTIALDLLDERLFVNANSSTHARGTPFFVVNVWRMWACVCVCKSGSFAEMRYDAMWSGTVYERDQMRRKYHTKMIAFNVIISTNYVRLFFPLHPQTVCAIAWAVYVMHFAGTAIAHTTGDTNAIFNFRNGWKHDKPNTAHS